MVSEQLQVLNYEIYFRSIKISHEYEEIFEEKIRWERNIWEMVYGNFRAGWHIPGDRVINLNFKMIKVLFDKRLKTLSRWNILRNPKLLKFLNFFEVTLSALLWL